MLTQVTDLGKLKFGQPHSFRFLVKNDSNQNVTIDKISVGCTSCTKAFLDKKNLGPSELCPVNIVFTPGTIGPQRKSVSLSYGGTSFKLEFIADVEN